MGAPESELWRAMCESSPDYMSIVDRERRFIWVNRVHPGLALADVLGSRVDDFVSAENMLVAAAAIERCFESGESQRYQVSWTANGESHWSAARVCRLGHQNDRVLLVTPDITRQVPAEQVLEDANVRLAVGHRLSCLGYWEWTIATGAVSWNAELYTIYGRSPESFVPSLASFKATLHPDDVQLATDAIERTVAHGVPYRLEHRVLWPDGEVRLVMAQGELVSGTDGTPMMLRGTALDITRSFAAEHAASLWESRFRSAVKAARQLVYDWDCDTDVLLWGGDVQQFFGCLQLAPLTLKAWASRLPTAERESFLKRWDAHLKRGGVKQDRYQLGERIQVEDHSEVVVEQDGRRHVVGLLTDISLHEQKQASLESELQRREALLREVHHRAKNNLQQLASLVNLQLGKVPGVEDVANSLAHRIQAMAATHDLLYQHTILNRVGMWDYVSGLVKTVSATFGSPLVEVSSEVAPVDLRLDVSKANPLGLILVELLTNSYQHAFCGEGGCVHISLKSDAQSTCLTVTDDGTWVKHEEGVSFGLELVQALAQQLGARLSFRRVNGTSVELVLGS